AASSESIVMAPRSCSAPSSGAADGSVSTSFACGLTCAGGAASFAVPARRSRRRLHCDRQGTPCAGDGNASFCSSGGLLGLPGAFNRSFSSPSFAGYSVSGGYVDDGETTTTADSDDDNSYAGSMARYFASGEFADALLRVRLDGRVYDNDEDEDNATAAADTDVVMVPVHRVVLAARSADLAALFSTVPSGYAPAPATGTLHSADDDDDIGDSASDTSSAYEDVCEYATDGVDAAIGVGAHGGVYPPRLLGVWDVPGSSSVSALRVVLHYFYTDVLPPLSTADAAFAALSVAKRLAPHAVRLATRLEAQAAVRLFGDDGAGGGGGESVGGVGAEPGAWAVALAAAADAGASGGLLARIAAAGAAVAVAEAAAAAEEDDKVALPVTPAFAAYQCVRGALAVLARQKCQTSACGPQAAASLLRLVR
ncbi:hypothetical protein HK405_000777, partial [Cladochytrium tenue]